MDRPVLAPGLRVLRRSRHELQVGLGAAAVRLPDTEPVRRTLAQLTLGDQPPDDPESAAVLAALTPVLVERGALVVPGVSSFDAAAAALRDPARCRSRVQARAQALVGVQGTLGPVDEVVRHLLSAAGVPLLGDRPDTSPTVVLVLSLGEPDRGVLDPLLRSGVPHLLVRLVEGTATVGPLVVPGRTACLRCLDAHLVEVRPVEAALVAQHPLAADDRRDGVVEPVDSALATIALGWAARDLVTHAEGDRPSTWSATVELAPALTTVTQTEWRRHPECGCLWLADEIVPTIQGASSTMVW